jgi:hypothetical protein
MTSARTITGPHVPREASTQSIAVREIEGWQIMIENKFVSRKGAKNAQVNQSFLNRRKQREQSLIILRFLCLLLFKKYDLGFLLLDSQLSAFAPLREVPSHVFGYVLLYWLGERKIVCNFRCFSYNRTLHERIYKTAPLRVAESSAVCGRDD